MAEHASDHGAVEMGGTVELADHQRTYGGFLTLLKWSTVAIAVIVALLFLFVFY